MNKKLYNQLKSVDWNFFHRISGMSKNIHWYPGIFPSEIPSTIIQAISKKDDIVFDPYGGIGTTASEAIRLGRKAYLTEINIIALLVSYTKCGLIILKALNEKFVNEIINSTILNLKIKKVIKNGQESLFHDPIESYNYENILEEYLRPTPAEMLSSVLKNIPPNWKTMSKWFEKETLIDIQKLWERINNLKIDSFKKLFCITMVSAILRQCSSQTKSWGHISDNVYPVIWMKKNIKHSCYRWIRRVDRIIQSTHVEKITNSKVRLWIDYKDWSSKKQGACVFNEKVDHIITSPPYANAIDYIRSQKLSFFLLGYCENDVDTMAEREIGSRRRRHRSNSIDVWASNLEEALELQIRYLSNEATISLVLPHKDSGRIIGKERIYDFLNKRGWKLFITIDRSIDQLNTNQSWTSIKKETIDIYYREKK